MNDQKIMLRRNLDDSKASIIYEFNILMSMKINADTLLLRRGDGWSFIEALKEKAPGHLMSRSATQMRGPFRVVTSEPELLIHIFHVFVSMANVQGPYVIHLLVGHPVGFDIVDKSE
jgi:hypothetical protein